MSDIKTAVNMKLLIQTHRKSLPSNFRQFVNRTVLAGMLRPIAKVSVAKRAYKMSKAQHYQLSTSRLILPTHVSNYTEKHLPIWSQLPLDGWHPKYSQELQLHQLQYISYGNSNENQKAQCNSWINYNYIIIHFMYVLRNKTISLSTNHWTQLIGIEWAVINKSQSSMQE